MTTPSISTTTGLLSAPERHDRHRAPTGRAKRLIAVTGIMVTVALCVFVGRTLDASADAGFGFGLANVTTNGFTHPWLGGYLTDVGTAWCIQSGRAYPRATGNISTTDLPAARGVSVTDRNALAYAVWAYTATRNSTTAAGLAAVVHGLSGDGYASVDVPSMAISHPAVKAAAVSIYREAESRAFWLSDPTKNPWKITTRLTHTTGMGWDAVTTVKTASGRAVAGHRVGLVPYNVTDAPATEHVATTNASGQIHTHWTQRDATAPIIVDAQTTAPTRYRVWKGPNYPAGSVPQRVITSTGTIYRGRGLGRLPMGTMRLLKSTDNPAYQSAVGATFDVIAKGVSTSVGTLTVGADGSSNVLELPIGDYVVTETSAPAGVEVDPTPYPVTVPEGAEANLQLTDPVRRQAGLSLIKVDAVTAEPVAGARLLVERDSDGDGVYDDPIDTFTSALTPTALGSLAAGDYQITEVAAPEGYELPVETVQHVSIGWDQTAAVTFADHRSVAVTTRAQLVDHDADLPAPPAGLDGTAHVVSPVGNGLQDTVNVTGLAPNEPATVTVSLYGPQRPDEAPSCDPAGRVFTDSWQTTGSGQQTSATFTPTAIGRYTWVASVEVPGFGTVTGPCGEVSESAIFTPTVDTVAQAPLRSPGAPVTDQVSVTGLAPGTTATVETALYGPFASVEAIADACDVGDLGDPVGVVHDAVEANPSGPDAPTVTTSSPIALPADDMGGWYTFVSTLAVAGLPPIGHGCGAVTETFEVTPPSTTTTTSTTSTSTTAPTTTLPATTTSTTVVPTTVPPTTTSTSTTTTSTTTTSTTTTTSVAPPPPSTTTSTTAPPSTTASTTTTRPAPPVTTTDAPAPPPTRVRVTGGGRGGTASAELPRTGARLDRLAASGLALALVGAAGILVVAARRKPARSSR